MYEVLVRRGWPCKLGVSAYANGFSSIYMNGLYRGEGKFFDYFK